jgi:hypothetical protein
VHMINDVIAVMQLHLHTLPPTQKQAPLNVQQ